MAVTTDPQATRLLGYLEQQRREMVELLERLARVESPSENRAALQSVLEIVAAELINAGLLVRSVRGVTSGGMLYGRPRAMGVGIPIQLLLGHCDTVWPMHTVKTMPVQDDGDTLSGPGVFDMKGGLVQMISALKALHMLELPMPANPVVLVNSDEETGSRDSSRLIRRIARRAARAFVLEPAFGQSGKLKTARKAVGNFTLTVMGRAAHAGLNPEAGASAILELSHQIQRLFALNDPARGITVNVGTIDSGIRPNVVASEVCASIDVRVRTVADGAEVEAAIR
jgi:glutamate carboxypeptidase